MLIKSQVFPLPVELEQGLVHFHQAHPQGHQPHTIDVYLFQTAGCELRFLSQIQQALRSQELQPLLLGALPIVAFFGLHLAQKLASQLIVTLDGEKLPIDHDELALCIHEDRVQPDCPVGDVEMVQEVECAHQVVYHAHYFDLLVVVVDYLSELGLQPIDLLVVAQPHLMGCGHSLVAVFPPELVQRLAAVAHNKAEAGLEGEVLEVNDDEGSLLRAAGESLVLQLIPHGRLLRCTRNHLVLVDLDEGGDGVVALGCELCASFEGVQGLLRRAADSLEGLLIAMAV